MPRKAKTATTTTPAADAKAPKKRGRKPSTKKAEVTETSVVVEEPLPGQLVMDETAEAAIAEAPVADAVAESIVAEAPAAPATDAPEKKTRKPRTKKADKKAEPVLITTLQVGDAEFDISDIAAKAYKAYKSTHKRKVVTEFRVYVKPEENAAYYTVNGEGSADFKIDL